MEVSLNWCGAITFYKKYTTTEESHCLGPEYKLRVLQSHRKQLLNSLCQEGNPKVERRQFIVEPKRKVRS